jgi:hypothetical protein
MNEVTIKLPNTLYRNLEVLAENEAVPLNQYIVYILTRQMSEGYTVRVVSDEDIDRQKASFDSLIEKWGRIPPPEAEIILDRREPGEPEPNLPPETVSRLKARIAQTKGMGDS